MTIAFIFRKPNPAFFSIERVFASIMAEMRVQGQVIEEFSMPRYGPAMANFVSACKHSVRKSAAVYHVTGDIHYAVLVLPPSRTVLTIHDCVFLFRQKGLKGWLLKRLFLDWPVRRCKMITTISEATKKDIVRFTGCRPEKIRVIPNPIQENIRYMERPFRKDRPRILFVGITPNKNLQRVINALAGLPCHLRVIGTLPKEAASALHERQVEYSSASGLTDDEMAAEYVKADLLLFPSLFEGFGLPIVEAQKTGRAVITSDRSPMKDVAGEGARLVDPESEEAIRSAVTEVIEDAAYRQRIIAAGRLNAARFDNREITRQYLSCYSELLDKSALL